MNAHRVLTSVFCVLLLAGCAGAMSIPDSPQGVIDEARSALLASVRLNRQYLNEGVLTPDEHDAKLAKIEDYNRDLEDAEKLLNLGKDMEAMDRAMLVRRLALALRAELAERAKK